VVGVAVERHTPAQQLLKHLQHRHKAKQDRGSVHA
jgi:hypothetical protein